MTRELIVCGIWDLGVSASSGAAAPQVQKTLHFVSDEEDEDVKERENAKGKKGGRKGERLLGATGSGNLQRGAARWTGEWLDLARHLQSALKCARSFVASVVVSLRPCWLCARGGVTHAAPEPPGVLGFDAAFDGLNFRPAGRGVRRLRSALWASVRRRCRCARRVCR